MTVMDTPPTLMFLFLVWTSLVTLAQWGLSSYLLGILFFLISLKVSLTQTRILIFLITLEFFFLGNLMVLGGQILLAHSSLEFLFTGLVCGVLEAAMGVTLLINMARTSSLTMEELF